MSAFKVKVFKTPWGPCVQADSLVRNLGMPLDVLIRHVGPNFHVGLFEGVHCGFIEVGGLHMIPDCTPYMGPEGVPGLEGIDEISGGVV